MPIRKVKAAPGRTVIRDERSRPTKGGAGRRRELRIQRKRAASSVRGWFRMKRRPTTEIVPVPPKFKDKYKDQVAIVMGTGPSLKDYDLTDPFFTENITFGGNNIGALFEPTFYCLTDPVAITKYWSNIRRCRSHFLLGEIALPVFYQKGGANTHVPHDMIQYDRADKLGKPGARIYHGTTIGMVMLHVAWLMGFKYIFLIGIDGYGVPGQKHATGNQPVGNVRQDKLVGTMLTLAMSEVERQNRFLFNLSYRSVHNMVPKYPLSNDDQADQ